MRASSGSVVFVHGSLSDLRSWSHQGGPFSADYRTVAFSCRHYFPSEGLQDDIQFPLATFVDDLAALLRALDLAPAREKAWVQLQAAVQRLDDAGLLGTKPVPDAAREINAMWKGLANAELRGDVLRVMPKGEEERAWLDALTTVVRGFASTDPTPARRRSTRRDA